MKQIPLPLLVACGVIATPQIAAATNLSEIYSQAKVSDTVVQTAKADKDAAFANVDAKRAPLLPQINLVGTAEGELGDHYFETPGDKPYSDGYTTGAKIVLDQDLYLRSSWIDLDIAEKQARQADADYAAAEQELIMRSAQAYFDVLKAQDELKSVQAEKLATKKQWDQAKQRHDAGLAAITDVYDAEAQYDTVLATEVLTENDLTNSYEKLRKITNQPYDEIDTLNSKRFSPAKNTVNSNALIKEAHEKNLELLAARIEKDVAQDRIKSANSGHLPSLHFNASYGNEDYQNAWGRSPIDHSHGNDLKAGLTLSVPVYNGGATSAKTASAQAEYITASQKLENKYREVDANIRAYNNNVSASYSALIAYKQVLKSAQAAHKATLSGFRVGTRTIVDVLNSSRRVFEAQRSLSDARYDYITAGLRVKLAAGSLTEQDILDINAGLESPHKNDSDTPVS
ncbi:TolC family outer membrane protein [Vibrio ezurae]|uniref:Outer membrane protein TolC n=1 Tax=Vibrio ezurae NBRC 102218 TaxID=1219080 RepID=U3AJV9_9VIBR|nr:TolC family outer membrane protein [Vibrio ezurae]GAD80211.1 outer membrane protein TolC [Vibrio ezurae NBRC 102218]